MNNDNQTRNGRIRELVGALAQFDHGDGCLRIIVEHALRADPGVAVEQLREICREAEEI